MAELDAATKVMLESALNEHMAEYAKASVETSVSHSNSASSSSVSLRTLSLPDLKVKIDEIRSLLGMDPMFEATRQLRPFTPSNF